ncbi:hypothetical protein D3C72_1713680 [compost metagenome]
MSCWKVIVAWVGRTPEMERWSPVVGSVTSVLFQVLRKPNLPPETPSLSVGMVTFRASWSRVPSPMLPIAA